MTSATLGSGADDVLTQIHEEATSFGGATEWEDILIKQGIKSAPTPEAPTADEISTHLQTAAEQIKSEALNHATLSDLSDMEDDIEDTVLIHYRQQRMAQMNAKAAKEKFGSIRHINEAEFVKEVTEASANAQLVVVHLYHPGTSPCELVHSALVELSRRHPSVKFIRIIAREAIHNFPDSKCPTLLCYSSGAVVAQLSTLSELGGDRTTADSIEWRLAQLRHNKPKSAVKSSDVESSVSASISASLDDEVESSVPLMKTKFNKDPAAKAMKMNRQRITGAARNVRRNSDEDEEEENDDESD